MRPIRLEMEGFGTFRERTVVDFAALDLVAFVGPTGSGKSTVIDALTFALYGSVARYDNPSLVAPVIHQLAVEARVRLDFEVAGRTYIAVRVVRRGRADTNRASTREARLELVEGDDRTTVLAGTVSELDEQVRALLGLDFAQFTRTIVLPQGDFARFIKGSASERQDLLSQLLDMQVFARMGGMARDRARDASQRAEALTDRLSRLDHATPAAVTALDADLALLAVLAQQAETELARLQTIEADLVAHRQACEVLDGSLAVLAAISVPADLARHDDDLSRARAGLEAAEAERLAARAHADRVREVVLAAGDRVELERLVSRRDQLVEVEAGLVALESERAGAVRAHDEATARVAELATGAEAAIEALRSARTGVDAAAWVARLVPGEPCPVCAQVVTSVPEHTTSDELARAEAEAIRFQEALQAARAEEARAQGLIQARDADIGHQAKVAADLAERLVDVPDLTTLRAQVAAAAEAAEQARAAEAQLRRADAAVAGAEQQRQRLEQAETAWGRAFLRQRDSVASLTPPDPDRLSLHADWQALAAWGAGRATELAGQRAVVATAGKEAAGAKAALLDQLRRDAAVVGLDTAPERLPVAVAERAATIQARQDQLRREVAEREELSGRMADVARDRAVNEALGQHLAANRFESWLLAEALDDIVDRANSRLLELSNGRYSLEVVDRVFAVRDHGNADERRDIKTLSGGETFLASLALALALADSIAELAPVDSARLESIFLDEGFGTLDAETLDVLASAIEELAAHGRLVVIVTHVRDLAERMPVRFEVRKGPTTSVIERVEG